MQCNTMQCNSNIYQKWREVGEVVFSVMMKSLFKFCHRNECNLPLKTIFTCKYSSGLSYSIHFNDIQVLQSSLICQQTLIDFPTLCRLSSDLKSLGIYNLTLLIAFTRFNKMGTT